MHVILSWRQLKLIFSFNDGSWVELPIEVVLSLSVCQYLRVKIKINFYDIQYPLLSWRVLKGQILLRFLHLRTNLQTCRSFVSRNIFLTISPCCGYPRLSTPWIGVLLDGSNYLLPIWGACSSGFIWTCCIPWQVIS